jgi:hypothetical protein
MLGKNIFIVWLGCVGKSVFLPIDSREGVIGKTIDNKKSKAL